VAKADRFLRACRREAVDTTPIWLMRQAGRFLPEYRALRQRHGFLEMVKTPELACEVTLQPLERFDLDAAIVFADILPLLEVMGLKLEFTPGDGPVIHNPIRSAADVGALATPAVEETLGFTLEAVRLVRRQLAGKAPLIGFSGAPFTLACYAIEGGGSKDFRLAKQFMHREPAAWYQLMDKLARMVGAYLKAQVAAGAQAIQLFDSWVGALSPYDFRESVLPHLRRALQIARTGCEQDVPLIYFSTDTAGLLPLFRETSADVIGVDWRMDLADAWAALGPGVAIQGNLDPHLLLSPVPAIERQAGRILDSVAGRPGHIFNLGHGVLKETPMEHVQALVDFVHRYPRPAVAQS